MHITPSPLETMIRPRLLVVAARHALADYDRDRHLPRLLGLAFGAPLPPTSITLDLLRTREATLERARKHHDASWRAAQHIALMTALMAEAATTSATCEPVAANPAA